MKKICKTCKYAKWQLTEKGNLKRNAPGKCQYEIITPKLPKAIQSYYVEPSCERGIWRCDDEEDCLNGSGNE